jgi:hypothetical protein
MGIFQCVGVGFPTPSSRDSPFLYPVFAILTGILKAPICRSPLYVHNTYSTTACYRSGDRALGQGQFFDKGSPLEFLDPYGLAACSDPCLPSVPPGASCIPRVPSGPSGVSGSSLVPSGPSGVSLDPPACPPVPK